ncbi:MAG: hypothetical protein ACRENB_05210 [Gemmatimonadales bacterium]
MFRAVPLLLLLLAGCSNRRDVAVEVRIPDPDGIATPIPGTLVVALPYDRDSILRALESRAGGPRPHTSTLDSLFQAFRGPFDTFARLAWRAERLRARRDSTGNAAARAALDDSLAQLEPELERARTELDRARQAYWPRIEKLRLEVRRWETTAYAGYDTIVRSLARDRLREGVADTTDALGRAALRLGPGSWWIHARSPDPADPNAEWYWNLPVTRDTVLLTPQTGERRPRY